MPQISVDFNADTSKWLLLDQAVQISGKSLQNFMFEAAWEKARSITRNAVIETPLDSKDQVQFILDENNFIEFVAQLNSQPKLNKTIIRLMSIKTPWEKS